MNTDYEEAMKLAEQYDDEYENLTPEEKAKQDLAVNLVIASIVTVTALFIAVPWIKEIVKQKREDKKAKEQEEK